MNPSPHSGRVTLPQRTFGGYIFDLDGTLVDSMPLHFRAWRQALAEYGAPPHVFDWQEFNAHGGMAACDIVQDLNTHYALCMPPQEVAARKRAIYAHLVDTETLPTIPETIELVHTLRERGIPYAIGTGSALPGAHSTLRAAGIDDLFPLIITPDDVAHGKPAPDIFLLAAQRMGVPASDCVVFEDAEPGLRAAHAAGMHAVRVLPAREETSSRSRPA